MAKGRTGASEGSYRLSCDIPNWFRSRIPHYTVRHILTGGTDAHVSGHTRDPKCVLQQRA